MRLLVDQNLPRRLAGLLRAAGHDAVHTEDEGLATAADPLILDLCCAGSRLLVTSDKKLTKHPEVYGIGPRVRAGVPERPPAVHPSVHGDPARSRT